jgi:hypothetical protein
LYLFVPQQGGVLLTNLGHYDGKAPAIETGVVETNNQLKASFVANLCMKSDQRSNGAFERPAFFEFDPFNEQLILLGFGVPC